MPAPHESLAMCHFSGMYDVRERTFLHYYESPDIFMAYSKCPICTTSLTHLISSLLGHALLKTAIILAHQLLVNGSRDVAEIVNMVVNMARLRYENNSCVGTDNGSAFSGEMQDGSERHVYNDIESAAAGKLQDSSTRHVHDDVESAAAVKLQDGSARHICDDIESAAAGERQDGSTRHVYDDVESAATGERQDGSTRHVHDDIESAAAGERQDGSTRHVYDDKATISDYDYRTDKVCSLLKDSIERSCCFYFTAIYVLNFAFALANPNPNPNPNLSLEILMILTVP